MSNLAYVRRASCGLSLLSALVLVSGCGGSSKPPEGAPQTHSDPTIDLGQETGPRETAAPAAQDGTGPTTTAPDAGSSENRPQN